MRRSTSRRPRLLRTSGPPPPYRGAPLSAQPPVAPTIAPDTPPHESAERLLAATDGALARTTLLQAASLPDQPAAAHRSDAALDLRGAVRDARRAPAIAQFEVSRDGQAATSDRQLATWRARFSLDVEPMGPVHALVALAGARASVTLWAERHATAARLNDNAAMLNDALRAAELEPADVPVSRRRAAERREAGRARPLHGSRHMTTPLAVALQYDKSAVPVPRVVAKGRGETGEAILALAREHGVPIEENAPLAEALAQVELGDDIPEALYRAVAEVLIFILRASRQDQPKLPADRAADAAEMGEARAGAVFQPEAERAVDADMRGPDQRDRQQIERRQQEARKRERDRHEQHVHRVVGDRARPRAEEIGGEAHVRHQDERGEQPPVRADAVIQVQRAERERRAFEPQQQPRHAFHGAGQSGNGHDVSPLHRGRGLPGLPSDDNVNVAGS